MFIMFYRFLKLLSTSEKYTLFISSVEVVNYYEVFNRNNMKQMQGKYIDLKIQKYILLQNWQMAWYKGIYIQWMKKKQFCFVFLFFHLLNENYLVLLYDLKLTMVGTH